MFEGRDVRQVKAQPSAPALWNPVRCNLQFLGGVIFIVRGNVNLEQVFATHIVVHHHVRVEGG